MALEKEQSFFVARRLLDSEVALTKILSFITRVPEPDELLQRAGVARWQLRQLELDDEVYQCTETLRDSIMTLPWRIEPNQTRQGKWLTQQLEPHILALLRSATDARWYGYAVFEIIFEELNGLLGLNRIPLKPMEWFAPKRDGSLVYFPDDGTGGIEGITVNPLKFLWVVNNSSYRNPYGEALLSRLWFPVTWRREGWGMWLRFLETFGEPIVLGQVFNYTEFVQAMQTQGVRSTIGWQSSSENDHVTTISASTPGEFERLENAIIRRIQKIILGQTLTSDIGSNGSYAVAAVHKEILSDKTRSVALMCSGLCQRLVDILVEVNGFKPHRFIIDDNLSLQTSRAARDSILSPVLAASGYRFTKKYLTDRYDINSDDIESAAVITPTASRVNIQPDVVSPPMSGRSVADSVQG